MNRDQLIASILKASSPKPIRLEVDSIGPVFVRVMTAYDADMSRKLIDAHKAKEDGCEMGRYLATLLCDEKGELLFDGNDHDTVLKLSKLAPRAQTAILQAANQANSADPKP